MKWPSKNAIRSIIFALLLVIIATLFTQYKPAKDLLDTSLIYIDQHKLIGSVIFVILFGVASCSMIPVTIFMLAAGVLFKPWPLAILVSVLGIEMGVIIGMLAGRTFLRPWVSSLIVENAKYRAIDDAVVQFGWKVVVLLRLTPIIPLGVANYLFSSTSLSIKTVMLSTLLGCFPGYTVIPILGSMMGSLQETRDYSMPLKYKLCLGLLVICFAIGSSVFFAIIAQNALKNMTRIDLSQPCSILESNGGESLDSHSRSKSKISLENKDKMIIAVTFSVILVILVIGIPLILIHLK